VRAQPKTSPQGRGSRSRPSARNCETPRASGHGADETPGDRPGRAGETVSAETRKRELRTSGLGAARDPAARAATVGVAWRRRGLRKSGAGSGTSGDRCVPLAGRWFVGRRHTGPGGGPHLTCEQACSGAVGPSASDSPRAHMRAGNSPCVSYLVSFRSGDTVWTAEHKTDGSRRSLLDLSVRSSLYASEKEMHAVDG
jgi:hypothetical protein